MEGQPPTPPPADAPPPDERPATVEDLRGVRRWIAVAGVWAVAATAIALIALLTGDDEDPERDRDIATAISDVRRDLNERVEELDGRVEELPTGGDVQRLQQRLQRVEDQARQAADDADAARSSVSELSDRVEQLEQDTDQSGGTAAPEAQGGSQQP